jgi:hypothetical protein
MTGAFVPSVHHFSYTAKAGQMLDQPSFLAKW